MVRHAIALCIVAVLSLQPVNSRADTIASTSQTVAELVNSFNQSVSKKANIASQPALTAHEVVASIRALALNEIVDHGGTVSDFERLQQLAETGMAPKGTEIRCITKYTNNDYVINVWWVDLYLPTKPEDQFRWTHRIRDRKLSSRPLSSDERRFIGDLKRQLRQAETN